MFYTFKFFIILIVAVIIIDDLSQPSAPVTRNGEKPHRHSLRNRQYGLISQPMHDSRPSLTSLHFQRKDRYGFSVTIQPLGKLPNLKFKPPLLTTRFHKKPFNYETRDAADVFHDDIADNADKWRHQPFTGKGLHVTTESKSKDSKRWTKIIKWHKNMKFGLGESNQNFEKQTRRHHHLIKRSYVLPKSRGYIFKHQKPQYFGENSDINHGASLFVTSHSSVADNMDKSARSAAYNLGHEHGSLSLCNFTYIRIDCSSRNLTDVPVDLFPVTVTAYVLSCNNIISIKNCAFKRYSALELLDLSQNKLRFLQNDSFAGLQMLLHLNLSRNDLHMRASNFPADVFLPLVSLEVLWIHKNNPSEILDDLNMSYPDVALSNLVSLKELYMDGLQSKDFGPGFVSLEKLHDLSLSGQDGNCKLRALRNATFKNVPYINHLWLQSCGIFGDRIDADAFSPLISLTSLNLNDNYFIGLENLKNVFYGLRKTRALKNLSIRHIVSRFTIGICLDSKYIAHFPQYLERLDVGDNALGGVDRDVIEKLSPFLNTLDVGANVFAFGTYLMDLPKMKNLTKLFYNGYRSVAGLPKFPSHRKSLNMPVSNCSLLQTLEDSQMLFRLPPNLKYVEINDAGLMNRLTEFNIDPNNELVRVGMNGNYFPKLIGPITGVPKLKTLFLNANNIRHISADFFRNLTSLETLDLSSNLLPTVYDKVQKSPVFSNLKNLTFLNLSCNEITGLHKDAFVGLDSLKELYLSENRLEKFTVNMSHMMELEMLDLSYNLITLLPLSVTEYIDKREIFTLNLAECLIHCSCDNFEFIKWFSQSKFKMDKRYVSNYRCTNSDNSFKYVSDRYQSTFAELRKLCVTYYIVYMVTAASTLFLVCGIFVAIIYRFRWSLRYFYYAAYLRYKKCRKYSNADYEFDVFISYAEEDSDFVIDIMSPQLESRGVKMLIHGRDFKAGEYIASNIVNAVGNSKKTLVVLTLNMMNSYWCGYEVQMANMESVQRGRKVLIFLLMEKIPESELGVELLYNIRNNTYIPYPDTLTDDTSMGRLWDKLVADIKN